MTRNAKRQVTREDAIIKSVIRVLAISIALLILPSACTTLGSPAEIRSASPRVSVLNKDVHSWNGATLPSYPPGQPEVTIMRIEILPRTRLDMHSHPVINAGVLISGQLTVVSANGKKLHLKAGDSLIELVDTWHYGINEGNVPADIIVFYAGIAGAPVTVVQPKPGAIVTPPNH